MFPSTFTLTSSAAEKAMDAACQEAAANGWSVTVAISDAGGVPILVKRSEAFPASYEIAVGKAKTAARERKYCNVIHNDTPLFISYLLLCMLFTVFQKPTSSLESAANVSDGSSRTALLSAPYILMGGGIPIFANEQCIGSVGVSGVKPNEDEQVAMAAVKALSSVISKL